MADTQSKTDLLEQNSKLIAEISELRKENAEIPELRRKFSEIENDKDTASENAELKARVANWNRSSYKMTKKRIDSPASDIDVTSNSNEYQEETPSQASNSFSSLEDKEMDNFLVERHNEQISNEIRERNRKKKLGSQDPLSYNTNKDITFLIPNETEFQTSNTNFTLLYEKFCDAIIIADHKTQEAIFCYCNFGKALIQRCNEITLEKQVDPEFNTRIEKAKKLYKLFDAISMGKIYHIHFFSADSISKLTKKEIHDNENFSDLKVEISTSTISQSKKNLLEAEKGLFPEKVLPKKLSEMISEESTKYYYLINNNQTLCIESPTLSFEALSRDISS
ncbi:hypothetical protein Glove_225g75 [Diversispora epigaea]|uniref:Uncharacterized protein n=1 Tax=Diversispora epigaea TaxID=1348612 RepID=A0A397IHN1_9GLOM|nr:hypothetical protein Glove_225g75 [Diversispora epigaea]